MGASCSRVATFCQVTGLIGKRGSSEPCLIGRSEAIPAPQKTGRRTENAQTRPAKAHTERAPADAPKRGAVQGTASVSETWRFCLKQRLDARASFQFVADAGGPAGHVLSYPFAGTTKAWFPRTRLGSLTNARISHHGRPSGRLPEPSQCFSLRTRSNQFFRYCWSLPQLVLRGIFAALFKDHAERKDRAEAECYGVEGRYGNAGVVCDQGEW